MADVVWFTDCDFVFGEGCLDALGDWEWPEDVSIAYAKQSLTTRAAGVGGKDVANWRLGDMQTRRVGGTWRLIDVDPAEFSPQKFNRAIGPLQIVRGDDARKYGYLDGTKWQQPRADSKPFGDFHDDVKFRLACEERGRMVGIDLPNLFRIRHTKTSYQEHKV